jgi:hypothetical protein
VDRNGVDDQHGIDLSAVCASSAVSVVNLCPWAKMEPGRLGLWHTRAKIGWYLV